VSSCLKVGGSGGQGIGRSLKAKPPGMPPNVQSPVQVQKAVAVPDGVNSKGLSPGGFPNVCRRQVGRRRIFVQTDTGSKAQ
jgi:hypothetical protein